MLQEIDTPIQMSSLTIFILCHNRPDFTRQTLHSILAQTDKEFELIVSDNSSNDEVERVVSSEFPQVSYRRRTPMLQPLAHFNQSTKCKVTTFVCFMTTT
jgi:cellulose synthase/poly-beta-1,6-N-acetylglucosamine synthase-like glycosyltransferase